MARKELSEAHQTFCDNVKARRKELGYTQIKMAEIMGITQGSYAGYEAGLHEPGLGLMVRIADALDTDLAGLVSVKVHA